MQTDLCIMQDQVVDETIDGTLEDDEVSSRLEIRLQIHVGLLGHSVIINCEKLHKVLFNDHQLVNKDMDMDIDLGFELD